MSKLPMDDRAKAELVVRRLRGGRARITVRTVGIVGEGASATYVILSPRAIARLVSKLQPPYAEPQEPAEKDNP